MSVDPIVDVERDDERGIAIITLDRPESLNALSVELRCLASDAVAELNADPNIGAVVLTGTGRAFSAGVDLREIGGKAPQPEPERREVDGVDMRGDDLVGAMTAAGVPIIGAVNGMAITGGFELALGCDIILASDRARFADTHARLGIMPGWGMTVRLPRLIGYSRAKELSLSSNFLDAETAERWGLVNRVIPHEDLLDAATTLAAEIATSDKATVRALNRTYDAVAGLADSEGLALEKAMGREHMRSVTPADIAARRSAVQERGRSQQSS